MAKEAENKPSPSKMDTDTDTKPTGSTPSPSKKRSPSPVPKTSKDVDATSPTKRSPKKSQSPSRSLNDKMETDKKDDNVDGNGNASEKNNSNPEKKLDKEDSMTTDVESGQIKDPKGETTSKNGRGNGKNASSKRRQVDREKTCPFLVRCFVQFGSHHHPNDYDFTNSRYPTHNEVQIHTWKDCTVGEFAALLADSFPVILHPETKLSLSIVYILSKPPNSGPSSTSQNPSSAPILREVAFINNAKRSNEEEMLLLDTKFQPGDIIDIAILNVNEEPRMRNNGNRQRQRGGPAHGGYEGGGKYMAEEDYGRQQQGYAYGGNAYYYKGPPMPQQGMPMMGYGMQQPYMPMGMMPMMDGGYGGNRGGFGGPGPDRNRFARRGNDRMNPYGGGGGGNGCGRGGRW